MSTWGQGDNVTTVPVMGKRRARVLSGACALCAVPILLWHGGVALGAVRSDPAVLLQLLAAGEAAYAEVRDYTATVRTVERIDGQLEPEQAMLLKFQRPFKVYMRWVEGRAVGREGLYVAGENDGKFLVADPSGLAKFFTARLDPQDPRIRAKTRHTVTDLGIGRLLEIVGESLRPSARSGALRVVDHGVGQVAGRPARQIEGILPGNLRATHYGQRVHLSFDEATRLPLRVMVYDWESQLLEDYTYTKLVTNPGLTAADFDPRNPAYNFNGWRVPW